MTLLSRSIERVRELRVRPPAVPTGSGIGMPGGFGGLTPNNQTGQMESYATVGWLFACVNRIAFSVATVPWKLEQGLDDKQEVVEGPLRELWTRPNPFYSRQEFVETAQQHLDLAGETYWVLVRSDMDRALGTVSELWPVRPDRMVPVPDPQEYLSGYMYCMGAERIPLETSDVVHIRVPNPMNPYRGLGPVGAILYDLGSERLAAQWTHNFFGNDATPGGVIEFPEMLGQDEFETFLQHWREQHRGVSNAHRVALIEKGVWKERTYSNRDIELTSLRHLNRDIILGAYGMPASMLGVAENVNRANAEAAEVMYSRHVIKPRLTRIQDGLNTRLNPLYGDDLLWAFIDPTPDDRKQTLLEAEKGFGGGFLTRNEARARVGEEPVDDEAGGADFKTPQPPSQARPPRALETDDSPPQGITSRDITDESDPLLPTEIEAHRRKMANAWDSRLESEVAAIIAHLGEGEKGLKADPGPFDSPSIVNADRLNRLLNYAWDWDGKYGRAVQEELTRAITLSITDGLAPGRRAQPDTGDLVTAHREAVEYARHRSASLLKLDGEHSLINVSRQAVRDEIAATLETGESLGRLSRRLRRNFAFSPKRATMVARTETAFALGYGHEKAASAQGLKEKGWITQGGFDPRVCDICTRNEGQGWIGISDMFQSGHQRVPAHPACMCKVEYRNRPTDDVSPDWSATSLEARCRCNRLLGVNIGPGAEIRCPRCGTLNTI